MANLTEIQVYAQDRVSELLNVSGFQDVDDVICEVEELEHDFDGDSYCPYYSQQDEVIRLYEKDFGDEAEQITDGKTYKASEWQEAQSAYAYAIAYCAFSSHFETAKTELAEGLQEFADDFAREFNYEDTVRVQVTGQSSHGWAAHDRELSDGTMIFESCQLDGCNGMERQIGTVWVSTCFDPAKTTDEDDA